MPKAVLFYRSGHRKCNLGRSDHLNCPKIYWINLFSSSDHISKSLLNWFNAHGFCQFIQFPTRGDNILDLVLADDNQIISRIYPNPPLGPLGHSDHCIVSFILDIEVTYSSNESPGVDRYR